MNRELERRARREYRDASRAAMRATSAAIVRGCVYCLAVTTIVGVTAGPLGAIIVTPLVCAWPIMLACSVPNVTPERVAADRAFAAWVRARIGADV